MRSRHAPRAPSSRTLIQSRRARQPGPRTNRSRMIGSSPQRVGSFRDSASPIGNRPRQNRAWESDPRASRTGAQAVDGCDRTKYGGCKAGHCASGDANASDGFVHGGRSGPGSVQASFHRTFTTCPNAAPGAPSRSGAAPALSSDGRGAPRPGRLSGPGRGSTARSFIGPGVAHSCGVRVRAVRSSTVRSHVVRSVRAPSVCPLRDLDQDGAEVASLFRQAIPVAPLAALDHSVGGQFLEPFGQEAVGDARNGVGDLAEPRAPVEQRAHDRARPATPDQLAGHVEVRRERPVADLSRPRALCSDVCAFSVPRRCVAGRALAIGLASAVSRLATVGRIQLALPRPARRIVSCVPPSITVDIA